MLTPEYLEECAETLLGMYDALNTAIIMDVAKRIIRMERVSEASEIQIMKLQECGLVYEDAVRRISDITGYSNQELETMFRDAGVTAIKNENDICTRYGAPAIDLKQSENMLKILSAGLEKTKGAVNNLTLTTANMSQDIYIRACDKAYLKVANGLTSLDQAVRDAVVEAAVQGNYVRYPSGHKDRLDVAIRRAVVTGVNQTTAQLNMEYCHEIGTDLVETTAHSGARPTHAEWQGQVFSLSGHSDKYEELESATGYGTGDGLCGWNCRHDFHAYIEGMPRTYTEEMLEDYRAAKYEYEGQKYTDYECSQLMRAQERKIRESKRTLAGLNAGMEEAASDTLKKSLMDEFEKKSVLLKQQEAKLKDICAKTKRYYQSARTQVSAVLSESGKIVGFNKSVSQKAVHQAQKHYSQWAKSIGAGKLQKTVANGDGSGIIKSGAVSGARNPYGKAAEEHAQRYYGLVRSMNTDVSKIAKVTGYSESEIQCIKNYIFMDKHDLGGTEMEYFAPDYMMAESWRRLIDGQPESHDFTLIKHEIMEKELVQKGYSQREAHIITASKYNYEREAAEFYDKIKKYKKE